MSEFVNEKLGARFTVPDSLTVRTQLAYYSARQFADTNEMWEANWRAAVVVMQDWVCDWLPDPKTADLETLTDRRAALLMMWAANQVGGHMLGLETVPKVSSPPSSGS